MDGTRQIAQRMVIAEETFVQTVQELTGCTREEAAKALTTMRKLKVLTSSPPSALGCRLTAERTGIPTALRDARLYVVTSVGSCFIEWLDDADSPQAATR